MVSEVSWEKINGSLNRFTRLQLMELDTCARCGLCTNNCPVFAGSGEAGYAPGVRASKMLRLLDKYNGLWSRLTGPKTVTMEEIEELADSVYNCTLCGRCMETCPFGFQTYELWGKLRSVIHELGYQGKNIARLEALLSDARNPYGLDADTRLDWADYTDFEDLPQKENAEIAYFVGCTTAYKGANQEIAHSIGSLLNAMGEDWTVLGENEWCCGSPIFLSGDEEASILYSQHNVDLIKERGIKKVITGCSGCFRILKWEYPVILGEALPFEVLHAVEYLRDMVASGKVEFEPLDARVTYHDPCELARLGGVINAPRDILRSFAKDFVELPENGIDSRCCGGGGLLQSTNNELRMAVIKNRLEQVKMSGAKILTSSCPACKLAYIDGVREYGYDVEVLDIMELASRQIRRV
jgi:heterodisulfide reductase subunit D